MLLDLHNAVHGRSVLDFDLVSFDANVIVAAVDMNAAILGTQPHSRLG